MGTYSFKSAGKTIEDTITDSLVVSSPPIGIKTPIRLGTSGEGIFAMHFDVSNQLQDNFRNMLLTNRGERIPLIDFGADLRRLVTELTNLNQQFDETVMSYIKKTTSKYMPFIELTNFASTIEQAAAFSHQKILKIQITYSVSQINVADKVLELQFEIA